MPRRATETGERWSTILRSLRSVRINVDSVQFTKRIFLPFLKYENGPPRAQHGDSLTRSTEPGHEQRTSRQSWYIRVVYSIGIFQENSGHLPILRLSVILFAEKSSLMSFVDKVASTTGPRIINHRYDDLCSVSQQKQALFECRLILTRTKRHRNVAVFLSTRLIYRRDVEEAPHGCLLYIVGDGMYTWSKKSRHYLWK